MYRNTLARSFGPAHRWPSPSTPAGPEPGLWPPRGLGTPSLPEAVHPALHTLGTLLKSPHTSRDDFARQASLLWAQAQDVRLHPGPQPGAAVHGLCLAAQCLHSLSVRDADRTLTPAPGQSLQDTLTPSHAARLMDTWRQHFLSRTPEQQVVLATLVAPLALQRCGTVLTRAQQRIAEVRRTALDPQDTLDLDPLLALMDLIHTPDVHHLLNAALGLDAAGYPGLAQALRPLIGAAGRAADVLQASNDCHAGQALTDFGACGAGHNDLDGEALHRALIEQRPLRAPVLLRAAACHPPASDPRGRPAAPPREHLLVEASGIDMSAWVPGPAARREVWLAPGMALRVTGAWPGETPRGEPDRLIAHTHHDIHRDARPGTEPRPFMQQGLWPPGTPRVPTGRGEDVPMGGAHGLQTRAPGEGRFSAVRHGHYGERPSKYLFTLDARGLNLLAESTAADTERGMVLHTNLSPSALAGGEAWFLSDDTVVINNGSARFGVADADRWDAVAQQWQQLGYTVHQVPWGLRYEPGAAPRVWPAPTPGLNP